MQKTWQDQNVSWNPIARPNGRFSPLHNTARKNSSLLSDKQLFFFTYIMNHKLTLNFKNKQTLRFSRVLYLNLMQSLQLNVTSEMKVCVCKLTVFVISVVIMGKQNHPPQKKRLLPKQQIFCLKWNLSIFAIFLLCLRYFTEVCTVKSENMLSSLIWNCTAHTHLLSAHF